MENIGSIREVLRATKFLRRRGGNVIHRIDDTKLMIGSVAWVGKILFHHLLEKYKDDKSVKIEVIPFSEIDSSLLETVHKKPWAIDPWINEQLSDLERFYYLIENPAKLIEILRGSYEDSANTPDESRLTESQIFMREMELKNKTIIKLRKKVKALTLKSDKPSYEELKLLIDKHRKSTGKVNYSEIGRILGKDPETIKNWIMQKKLLNYALNR